MLFLNNTEEPLTPRAAITNLEVFTCTDKGIQLETDSLATPMLASIIQMTGKTFTLTQKEQDFIDELKLHQNEYLKNHPDIKHKVITLVLKFADVFTPNAESRVGVTDLIDMKLKMKPGQ